MKAISERIDEALLKAWQISYSSYPTVAQIIGQAQDELAKLKQEEIKSRNAITE